jgi:hypothetical protein
MKYTSMKTKRRNTGHEGPKLTALPVNPFSAYLGHGWNGWRAFLGAKYICDSCGADFQQGCKHSDLRAFDDWKYFASSEEQTLADVLNSYTDPASPEYDAAFAQEIRKAAPHWFESREGTDMEHE